MRGLRRFRLLAGAAAVVWLVTTALVLSGDWQLSCTVDGHELGGIDCLQANAVPQTDAAPARWIGFVPLAAAWLVAAGTVVVCLVLWWRVRTRRA